MVNYRSNQDLFIMKRDVKIARLYVAGLRSVLALTGLAIALFGTHWLSSPPLNDNVLVWVNQQPVTSQQMQFVAGRLGLAPVDTLSAQSRQALLQLLVDEELLLQRAESLGVHREDPGLRKQLVQSVISEVVADFLTMPVDDRQILRFYRQHKGMFESSKRVAVSVLPFVTREDAERARFALLASGQLPGVKSFNSNALLSRMPSSPIPAHMLRRYLGTTLAARVLELEPGEVTDPVAIGDGFYLVYVRHVKAASIPDFEIVRAEVRAEYLRRGRDRALEKVLASLSTRSNISINRRAVALSTIAVHAENVPSSIND